MNNSMDNVLKQTNTRIKDGEVVSKESFETNLLRTIINSLYFEFGYGIVLKEIEREHIVIETNVLGTIDRSRIEGSKEDLQILKTAIHLYYKFVLEEQTKDLEALKNKYAKGASLLIETGTPLFIALHKKGKITAINCIIGSMYLGDDMKEQQRLKSIVTFMDGYPANDLEELLRMYEPIGA